MIFKQIAAIVMILVYCSVSLSSCTKSTQSTGSSVSTTTTGAGISSAVHIWPEVTYEHDGYSQQTCSGTDALSYTVISPDTTGLHPIVFGMGGTGFQGSAGCSQGSSYPEYLGFNGIMANWAKKGFVAVNIEYHGFANGLYGNVSYPGAGKWKNIADGTVQIDIKPAIRYFLSNDPAKYGADPTLGVVIFGASSGAHNAYMVGATQIAGVPISAVVGWSGLPDVSEAGNYPNSVFDRYMRASPGSDVEKFGDPMHRINSAMAPQYIANGLSEFISPLNAIDYAGALTQNGIVNWLRIPDTDRHASGYAFYKFTDQSPEESIPSAPVNKTVMQDSINFALKYVKS